MTASGRFPVFLTTVANGYGHARMHQYEKIQKRETEVCSDAPNTTTQGWPRRHGNIRNSWTVVTNAPSCSSKHPFRAMLQVKSEKVQSWPSRFPRDRRRKYHCLFDGEWREEVQWLKIDGARLNTPIILACCTSRKRVLWSVVFTEKQSHGGFHMLCSSHSGSSHFGSRLVGGLFPLVVVFFFWCLVDGVVFQTVGGSGLSGAPVHHPRCGRAPSSLVRLGLHSHRHEGRGWAECAASRLHWAHWGQKMSPRRWKSKLHCSVPRRNRDEARSARACKRQATAVVREGTPIPESSGRWSRGQVVNRSNKLVNTHRPWCPTQSSEASFWFTGIVALGLGFTPPLHRLRRVSKKPGNSCHRSQEVLLINHGIQVRACPRPHFWTVRRERRLSWTPPAQRQTVTTDVSGRWCFTVGLTEERRRLMQSGWAPHPMQRTQVGSQFWRSRVRARECGSESRKPPQSRPHSWRLRMFWSTIWHGEIQTSAVTNRASQTRKVWATWWEHHHGESHRDTRAVSNLFEQLAGRIGAIPVGGELPRALRQQRWSPVNVPLIWAARRVCPSFVFKK